MIWSPQPSQYYLPDDIVHLWKVDLNVSSGQYQACYRWLNSEERKRAARYKFTEPRNRFVVARAALRQLIGRYIHREPETITFDKNAWGKPALSAGYEAPLEFNIAHSHYLALFAFSRNRMVGVDVEFMQPINEVDRLVANFFSANEQMIFKKIPTENQLHAFFTGWTRKEAYIKGRGMGLSIPLDSFDVTIKPGEPAALLRDTTDDTANLQWHLMDVQLEVGYTAALAIESDQGPYEVLYYTYHIDTDIMI